MSADFTTLFEDADGNLATIFPCQLLQPNGSGQPGNASANNDNVIFHRFALAHHIPLSRLAVIPALIALRFLDRAVNLGREVRIWVGNSKRSTATRSTA